MIRKVVRIASGIVLILIGIPMLVLPGPGLAFIIAGVALVLSQFIVGRRVIARVRVWARDRFGSAPVHTVERRLPRTVVPDDPTQQIRIHAERRRKAS